MPLLVGECVAITFYIFKKETLTFIATLGLNLGFSAKLRIWQVSSCKMEPQSGTIFGESQPEATTQLVSFKSPVS